MLRLARPQHRSGFTLVEILVAIGIIITLAAILVVALGNSGVRAREEATATLIRKVSNQVQERLEALDRLRSQPQFVKDSQKLYPVPSYKEDQAKILYFKDLMKLAFPQSFAEFAAVDLVEFKRALDPTKTVDPMNTKSAYQFYTDWKALPAHANHSQDTESSALLYYALTNGKTFGTPTVDPGDFRASEISDTDNDGLLEFIDSWGRPLRFYRWPTRQFCPTGTYVYDTTLNPPRPIAPQVDRTQGATLLFTQLPAATGVQDPLVKDPDDPTLALFLPKQSVAEDFEKKYHTPFTYHNVLIISSGADGQKIATPDDAFGLLSPSDQYVFDSSSGNAILDTSTTYGYLCQPKPGKFDALTDNITNRNR